MTAEILIKFARKGIILSPEAYQLIASSDNPLNLSSEIIVKLKSGNYSKDMVPVDVDTLKKMDGLSLKLDKGEKAIETPMEKPAPTLTKPKQELKPKPEEKLQQPTQKKPEEEQKQATLKKPEEKLQQPTQEKPKESVKTTQKPKNPGYASEHVVKIE